MLKIFNINNDGLPEISVEARTILPFKKLITRDKGSEGDHDGRKKYRAAKELAFVYWYSKFDTPYEQFTKEDRIIQIKKAVGLPEEWKPDRDIKEACDYFYEIQKTKSMIHLESVSYAIEQLSNYLRNTDVNERIRSGPKTGELVHDLNKYKTLSKEMPDMIEAYQKMKELVKKELQEEEQLRAGRKENKYTS